MALGTGVGAELGVAADAHRLAFVPDEPLPPEVLAAVETVRAVGHFYSEGCTWKSRRGEVKILLFL